MMTKTLISLFLSSLFVMPVFAHEYWFEPDSFFLKPGEATAVHLFVGEALKQDEERVFQAGKTTSFQLFSSAGTFDLRSMGNEDKAPIVNFASDRAGSYMLSMERNWSYITLDVDKFDEYLREDGMEYIISERERLGESKKAGRERYSRYLKTLIQIGDRTSGPVTKRIGGKLEIVPLNNPYSKKKGDKVTCQVWFDGRPLAGKTIFADNRFGDEISSQKMITDPEGKVTVKLSNGGIWLIRLVYMQRCERSCAEVDWESFWGALSFGVK